MKTRLLYLENTYLHESSAKILAIEKKGEDGVYVLLDSTIFYPQGGGQPSDIGEIRGNSEVLKVFPVRMVKGEVHHYVEGDSTSFKVGQMVSLRVDGATRLNHARLHTAGHVLAIAASKVFSGLKAVKGHHFPGACYVEFEGVFQEGSDTGAFIEALNNQLTYEVERNWPIRAQLLPGGDFREIQVGDYPAVPCGGTHVAFAAELGTILVRKVKSKKGRIKVSYHLMGG